MPASPDTQTRPAGRRGPRPGNEDLPPEHRPARPPFAEGGARIPETHRPQGAGIQPQRRLPLAARKAGDLLRAVPDQTLARGDHRHHGRLRGRALRLHVVPQPGRRNHRSRTGLRQLHGLRHIGGRRDPPGGGLHRERIRTAPDRGVREADQRPHARHPDLQPQQPHGLPLHPPRDEPHPRHGEEIRPVPLFRTRSTANSSTPVRPTFRPATSKASNRTSC